MKKPLVLAKIKQFLYSIRQNKYKIGVAPRTIIINYNNTCNFRCNFCYSHGDQEKYKNSELSFDTISNLADQAHILGYFDISVYGGELLINQEKLYKLIQSLKPERFEVSLITNGYLMTQKIAYNLADLGVDCVGVSISSLNSQEHDQSRGIKGSHEKAIKALEYIDKAGMLVWPQAIFSHYNARTTELEEFLKYTTERGWLTFFNMSAPYGLWHDNKNFILDDEDMEILNSFRKKYKCNTEFWDPYDVKKENFLGCNTGNRLYITPLGDVFPCSYIHISLGNILKQSLKEVVDYAFTIKWFRNFYPYCLAGNNKEFRDKFFKEERSIFNPLIAQEVFRQEDYVDVIKK
jgi:MoaA/NifB/PqqE/SkfB family radical SAM enzyme